MNTVWKVGGQLSAVADFLAGRHEAVTSAWRKAVEADPELVAASSLSLLHFEDELPDILEDFERSLREGPSARRDRTQEKRLDQHGVHRWQQGYSLRELVHEWGHIQTCVLRELESYGLMHPELDPEVLPAVREAWVRLCGEGIARSVAEYSAAQQAEASGHLRDLHKALQDVRVLERQRAEAWHQAAHDLRGNVGLVTTTASIFSEKDAPEALRDKALGTLQSSVSSLHELLEDLLSLARLEAGQEQRHLEPFDAAARLRELCATLEPVAHERGLFLRWEGPETLSVEGDAAKMQRIVQNLALNALKYTASGGVTVSWSESWGKDSDRWQIRIQDTGPGLQAALATPLGLKLTEATSLAREVEDRRGEETEGPVPDSASPAFPPGTFQPPGEGIGLSIVKRLCELLDAGLEVATAGKGTVFQVVLPRRYSCHVATGDSGPARRSAADRVGR